MSGADDGILVRFARPLVRARWVRRYKRFLIDVELEDGEVVTAHCPNPGRMTTAGGPGSELRLSVHDDPRRKLSRSLELVRLGRGWLLANPMRANALAEAALRHGLVTELSGYDSLRSEVRVREGTRLDFALERGHDRCLVEVKSVTLARDGVAAFPDAVTSRGARHLEVLGDHVERGERAVILYLVHRSDAGCFEPADDVDPEYGKKLREAVARGVEILVYQTRVGPRGLGWGQRLAAKL